MFSILPIYHVTLTHHHGRDKATILNSVHSDITVHVENQHHSTRIVSPDSTIVRNCPANVGLFVRLKRIAQRPEDMKKKKNLS